jgi:hypothetical protein
MQDIIRVGEKWVNRFSNEAVTVIAHNEGKDVDYVRHNPTCIPELKMILSSFTKPEHIFHRQYKKIK